MVGNGNLLIQMVITFKILEINTFFFKIKIKIKIGIKIIFNFIKKKFAL